MTEVRSFSIPFPADLELGQIVTVTSRHHTPSGAAVDRVDTYRVVGVGPTGFDLEEDTEPTGSFSGVDVTITTGIELDYSVPSRSHCRYCGLAIVREDDRWTADLEDLTRGERCTGPTTRHFPGLPPDPGFRPDPASIPQPDRPEMWRRQWDFDLPAYRESLAEFWTDQGTFIHRTLGGTYAVERPDFEEGRGSDA